MRLLYFGRLAELAGSRGGEVDPPADIATVADLRAWLPRQHPGLAAALGPGVRAVIGDAVVADDRSLAGVTELAFLPPVSGG